MPAITWQNALAALLFALLGGFAWNIGARVAGKLL